MEGYLSTRRQFLKQSSLAVAGLAISSKLGTDLFAAEATGVSIIVAADDSVAGSAPPQWAISQLKQAIEASGAAVRILSGISQAPASDLVVVVGLRMSALASQIGGNIPATREAMALVPGTLSGRQVVLASGNEARGLVYSVLELTDRILSSDSVAAALAIGMPIVEESHNPIRSICRSFQSALEDKPWLNDKAFWTEYLSMLASERINRFNLSFGLGQNWGSQNIGVSDAYLFFIYPFLVSVGGVSVANLAAAERDANLAMLKFISDECAKRALDFQLGIWTSGFTYTNSGNQVQGLNTTNGSAEHANYCRDALAAILQACPNITGVTFRVHEESGIPSKNFTYWQTVFSAFTSFANAGRMLEVDMHAKNCYQGHIDAALASRARVVVSPKKWAEHQGLPYHQASLRASERSGSSDPTVFDGQASRYGYSNFLKEDRKYGILHRLWPGTQRHLLWADPVFAAGYGRSSAFCGSLGMELYEPLSFKGREGTGTTGGRCAYSDASLTPAYDYQKFLLYYRVMGRCLYNPDTDPANWRRYYAKQFGSAGRSVEDALGNASRILMLVATYHGASADNHGYWPEVYTNFSIVDGQPTSPDSGNPLRAATSFDPQLFLDIDPYAEALLGGNEFGQDKYFPVEFSQWVEDFANAAASNLAAAQSSVPNSLDPAFRRMAIDVSMQSKLGLFFGQKFRSGVLWSIYRKTNDANAKAAALELYNNARQSWTDLVSLASAYKRLTYGSTSGHWSDRTAAITNDIDAMKAATFSGVTAITTHPGSAAAAIAKVKGRPNRPQAGATHSQPNGFSPGTAVTLTLNGDAATVAARLYYRHVNQADAWQSAAMTRSGTGFQAAIPVAYTRSDYSLQYYFAVDKGVSGGTLFPGFDVTLANQPYFVIRPFGASSGTAEGPIAARAMPTLSDITVIRRDRGFEIQYTLNRPAMVSASLFDLKGRLVASFIREHQMSGVRKSVLRLKSGDSTGREYELCISAGDSVVSKTIFHL